MGKCPETGTQLNHWYIIYHPFISDVIDEMEKVVSECCLTHTLSTQFSAISGHEQVTFQWDDDVGFVLDQHLVLAHWKQ